MIDTVIKMVNQLDGERIESQLLANITTSQKVEVRQVVKYNHQVFELVPCLFWSVYIDGKWQADYTDVSDAITRYHNILN
jgi:hypothetical protein